MRTRLLLVLLAIAAITVAGVLAWRKHDSGRTALPTTGSVTLVGDSLNVGIEPYLQSFLPGWAINADDEVGRATSAGLDVLREQRADLSPIVVVSLGTNDSSEDVAGFRANVRRALAIVGPGRCVVWVNIARDGEAYDGFDAVLDEEAQRAENLRLVDWAAIVRAHPEWLTGDGIHPSDAGYRRRAEAVADTVRRCPRRASGDDGSP